MAEQSLKDKTVKGVGWSATDAFWGQGVTFLIGIVLARILSPAESVIVSWNKKDKSYVFRSI